MASPTDNLRIEIASEADIPSLTALTLKTFSIYALETEIGNTDTPEGIAAATPRFQRAWHEHMSETSLPSSIKCIYTDPVSGEESLAACTQWFIFPTPRSREDVYKPNYLNTADWVPENGDGKREKALRAFQPVTDSRIKWSHGRGIGILQYMATHEDWRRKGAATLCVQWGMERCRELGIPAYLEASPTGRLVYEKLGFELVDEFEDGMGTTFPVMMWWPPGTSEADKRPLPPQ